MAIRSVRGDAGACFGRVLGAKLDRACARGSGRVQENPPRSSYAAILHCLVIHKHQCVVLVLCVPYKRSLSSDMSFMPVTDDVTPDQIYRGLKSWTTSLLHPR